MYTASLLLLAGCGALEFDAPELEPQGEIAAATAELTGFATVPGELGVTDWVRGEPVDLSGEKLVLVEHWATWCGPCKEQIPHLTELQAAHAEQLTVVGLSDEPAKVVAPFVAKNEARMGYTVAAAEDGAMGAWSRWAGASGIPYSYLVQGGKVLWHGHPGGLDPVLAKALEGGWTAELAAAHAAMPRARKAYLLAISTGSKEDARHAAQPMLDHPDIGASVKNEVAWGILTEVPEDKRDLELALALAKQATAETEHEDMALEDTLGLALFMSGEVDEAVEVQARAVALCADHDGPKALCDELSQRLDEFKAAAEG